MIKKLILALFIFLPFVASAIEVKIENTRMDLNDIRSNQTYISSFCKLTVAGIKGQNFHLAALVKDDAGNWHKTQTGETCWVFEPLNSPYESSTWKEVGVFLPHSILNPKVGQHNYEVWLYVLYNGEWYGGVKVGSYSQTGASAQSSSSGSRSSSSSHSHSNSYTCTVCNGNGVVTCLACGGMGGSSQWRCMTTAPYSTYYEWVTCIGCQGAGKVTCYLCSGSGQLTMKNNNYNSGGGYSGGYYNSGSNNSSSGSSVYAKCRICGGSGRCTSCNGSGGEWKSYGYYTGEATSTWVECPSCHGKKTCFNCYGTGRQ